MKFVVAVTNNLWFADLRALRPDEVNFWSPGVAPVRLDIGTPWLFKLHAPHNFIVGGGYFTYRTDLPLRVAWDTFGPKNGADSLQEFQHRIGKTGPGEMIGCTVLSEPFFWDEDEWLPLPPRWASSIQARKAYDTSEPDAADYWARISERIPKAVLLGPRGAAGYGKPTMYLPRLGQGGFRSMVIDAYNRRCAVTGERTLPALEAAHIKPFSEMKTHDVRNGVLLRADIHRLFDDGYVTINPDRQFEVSKRIKDDFENGRDYYALHGRSITVPANPTLIPSTEFLAWHASKKYLG